MQLTFSEKASIMPQYATGNAAKEAGVRARFLFHFSFAVRFSVFSPAYQCCALIIKLRIDYHAVHDYHAAHDYHAGVWIGFREHAQP